MNESKKNDPRQWDKWRQVGSISGPPERAMATALAQPIEVVGVAVHMSGGREVNKVLSLGV